MGISRRSFLQHSAAGAAAVSISSPVVGELFAGSKEQKGWVAGMQINPSINNTKVVCCFDTAMIKEGSLATSFTARNSDVNTETIEKNMDAMAIRLASKSSGLFAWETIFQKPSGKEWKDVKAAIKVNCINNKMMPNIAIVGKVCKVLAQLGIPESNITIYDACHNASGDNKYNGYIGKGLPAGVIVSNVTNDGDMVKIGSVEQKCTKVVTGCDILVNCAINKGHNKTDLGGFTLSMKNHTGTMNYTCPSLTEMIDQNKSDAIIGGTPARQQLCIVDCLWSAKNGPMENASHITNRIVMGTFGPLVDIAVVKKIREPVMNAAHEASAISTILTSFGYAESDIQWDEFTPDSSVLPGSPNIAATMSIRCTVENSGIRRSCIDFTLPANASAYRCAISDLKGRVIRKLTGDLKASHEIVWDGLTSDGRLVKSGHYAITFIAAGMTLHGSLLVRR